MIQEKDTIAAISTAAAPSGIGIVRISGPDAIQAADEIYRSRSGKKKLSAQKTHTIHYGYIIENDMVIDEVLVSIMRAPHSFTAEDTVEINCHGGVCAVRKVLETVLNHGVRIAQPGEFTKRAFLNGRIDLSQAEAVIDVIQAKNEYALAGSVSRLRGSLMREIRELRSRILTEMAYVEAALDDPEHISLDHYADRAVPVMNEVKERILRLIKNADNGRVMQEGIRTVILGKPNAGKSSLLNVMAGEERAIVTDIAGTTRDMLMETINLGGITLQLIDTAGIRDSADRIEQMGVEIARKQAQMADLILYVADSSCALDENDQAIWPLLEGKQAVILLNKSDLDEVTTQEMLKQKTGGHFPVVSISALEQKGMEELEQVLKNMFYSGKISFNDEIYLSNARQKNSLKDAAQAVDHVLEGLESQMPEDFLAMDMRGAYESLGEITGESLGEDLVNEIFSRFCMGK